MNLKPVFVWCLCCDNDKRKQQKRQSLFDEFSYSFNA